MLWLVKTDCRWVRDCLLCMGPVMISVQALRSKEYIWAFGFAAIAALFNPFVPFLKPAGNPPLSIVFIYIATFVISLAALSTQPAPMTLGSGPAARPGSVSEFVPRVVRTSLQGSSNDQ